MYNGGFLRKSLYFARAMAKDMYGRLKDLLPPCFDSMVQYVTDEEKEDEIYIGQVGDKDFPATARVGGVFLSAGTIETGIVSTSLTYRDPVTNLDVVDTTDVSGNFVVGANGLTWLRIDGLVLPVNESVGLIIGAINGLDYYTVTGATWDTSDNVYSYSDDVGYTGVADGSTMYWDVDTTELIASGANIPYGSGFEGEAPPVTEYEFTFNASDNVIDLGITPVQLTDFNIYGRFNSLTSPAQTQIHGCRTATDTDEFMVGINNTNNVAFIDDTSYSGSGGSLSNRRYRLYNGAGYVYNGETLLDTLGTDGTSIGTPTEDIYIGCYNNGGVATLFTNFTMQKCEVTHNGVLHEYKVVDQAIEHYADGIYQEDVTIQGTVLSGQWTEI